MDGVPDGLWVGAWVGLGVGDVVGFPVGGFVGVVVGKISHMAPTVCVISCWTFHVFVENEFLLIGSDTMGNGGL